MPPTKKGAPPIKKQQEAKPKPGEFLLNPVLHEDVQVLENAKRELITNFRLMQSELAKMEAEINGMDGSIYSIFRTDALTNGRIGKNQKVQFLGNFKYKVIDIPQQEQPNSGEPLPPAGKPEEKQEEANDGKKAEEVQG